MGVTTGSAELVHPLMLMPAEGRDDQIGNTVIHITALERGKQPHVLVNR